MAYVTEGDAHSGYEYTAVEKHTHRHGWREVDRSRPCRLHEIPKKIYQQACDSN